MPPTTGIPNSTHTPTSSTVSAGAEGAKPQHPISTPPLAKDPCPIGDMSGGNWFANIKTSIEAEKKRLESAGSLRLNDDGSVTIDPSLSEKFCMLLRSAVDSIANLLGKKEQSALSGYCAASALVRGATPALRQIGHARDFSIAGLVLTSAYLLTTSVNLATAMSAYAKSCATQSEHLSWIIKHLPQIEELIKDKTEGKATPQQAAVFNEFMQRIENINCLMKPAKLKEEANNSAVLRESAAMLPGGIISETSGINGFTHVISAIPAGVLSEVSSGFQVLGGVLDIKQALTEKEIVRMNIAETKAKMNSLSRLKTADASENINTLVESFTKLQEAGLTTQDSHWLTTDFRLFKGSMAIPAGLAGAAFTGLLIAKAFGVFVLTSAAITLTLTCLSVLSGIVLLVFLSRISYLAYCGWQEAKNSLEMKKQANDCLMGFSDKGPSVGMGAFIEFNHLPSNPYLLLDQFAKILMHGTVDVGFRNTFNISRVEAERILNAVGVNKHYLDALLLEAIEKGGSGLEWLKSRIGKHLNIDYSSNATSAIDRRSLEIPSGVDITADGAADRGGAG